jgi:prolyl-tRNA editing enzyme YbaK/EbsC (Cys-tRNA(Pro) deacylase)
VLSTAKINVTKLRTLVHELRKPDERLSKNKFHFQLADDDVSFQLSGFGHNAICPVGMTSSIPVIICNRCLDVKNGIIYLGGGKVDVKLALPVSDLVACTNAITGNITEER